MGGKGEPWEADGFAVYSRNLSDPSFITNNGTIRGGSNADPAFAGGAAIRGFGSQLVTITNGSTGTLQGGNASAAIATFTQAWNVRLITSGTISAGAGQSDAIQMGPSAGSRLAPEP